ncbi:MAG: urease accessory protein UreE [Verrucomicrobiota bacterium]|nr:urease accessory protein UreE [Verrucomicrobiota bacterium]
MTEQKVALRVDRLTLAKRRWRGAAENGREFGFDLEHALADGEMFFGDDEKTYVIAQKPEWVLELPIGPEGESKALRSPIEEQLRVAWMIGNLHFQIEIGSDFIRVADDPAVRQLFEREGLHYDACERVFHPLSGHQHH